MILLPQISARQRVNPVGCESTRNAKDQIEDRGRNVPLVEYLYTKQRAVISPTAKCQDFHNLFTSDLFPAARLAAASYSDLARTDSLIPSTLLLAACLARLGHLRLEFLLPGKYVSIAWLQETTTSVVACRNV